MDDYDALVARLILHKIRDRDFGWRDDGPPEHFVTCPDVTVSEPEAQHEMWWDTGVDATRITVTLTCPHEDPVEWEWADLGELPDLLHELDGLT